MKAYGLTRYDAGDTDVEGCRNAGRATSVYALSGPGGDARALKSLRGGRKAAVRRAAKRRARRDGRTFCEDC